MISWCSLVSRIMRSSPTASKQDLGRGRHEEPDYIIPGLEGKDAGQRAMQDMDQRPLALAGHGSCMQLGAGMVLFRIRAVQAAWGVQAVTQATWQASP